MCVRGLNWMPKMTNFGQIWPKMVPMAIFKSRIVVENEIVGDYQYKSIKSPYMMAIFKRKQISRFSLTWGIRWTPPLSLKGADQSFGSIWLCAKLGDEPYWGYQKINIFGYISYFYLLTLCSPRYEGICQNCTISNRI